MMLIFFGISISFFLVTNESAFGIILITLLFISILITCNIGLLIFNKNNVQTYGDAPTATEDETQI